ncbi:MAG: PIG-L family deacetylase [Verrucomicrobia bacterium]|nr:PIG-L family deacetylase [Verrucomicrobiota bacterium]
MSLIFQNTDRLLIIAPHPDDESLATGGLIQRLRHTGTAARVLLVTNGDNNPWPQRWLEKRWRIGHPERERWGTLRRRESRFALKTLGFEGETRFLQFPDQGLTAKLLRADQETVERFCAEIQESDPTHIVLPSSYDLHPDHNALNVLLQIALDRMGRSALPQFQFLVHCKRPDLVPSRVALPLVEHERHVKRQAILCHTTQMALSRKRFLAYARPEEAYYRPEPVQARMPHHCISEAFLDAGELHLTAHLPAGFRNGCALLVAGESAQAGSVRWRLKLPITSRKVALHDTIADVPARDAIVRITGRVGKIKIPVAAVQPFSRLFVKLHYQRLFLDLAGWREVPVL